MARILAEWEKNSELQQARGQDEKDRQMAVLAKRLEVHFPHSSISFFFLATFETCIILQKFQ